MLAIDSKPTVGLKTKHLFDEDISIVEILEYGVSWDDLMAGKVAPPAEGAHFDIHFAGTFEGDGIKGEISGIDYLVIRADRRPMLNIHAKIITDDGVNISVYEDGIFEPTDIPNVFKLNLNLKLVTSVEKYKWVNHLHIWAQGTVDMSIRKVAVSAFAA